MSDRLGVVSVVGRRIRLSFSALGAAWRRSLQFRMVVLSLTLTLVAVFVSSAYMSSTIGNDLFQSKLQNALVDSRRALSAAQNIFDSSNASSRAESQDLMATARAQAAQLAATNTMAGYRGAAVTPSPLAPQDFESPALHGVITDELRRAVRDRPQEQWWQSVEMRGEGGAGNAGLVIGGSITLTDGSPFEIYLGFDLRDTERTLQVVQQTLILGGLALLLLVGAITWALVRRVARPVREVAVTSERFADGDLEVRIPVRGEDELASLARSFNGMADSIRGQIGELAELSAVQQRFVSDVSHELRTPLTTIRLAGEVLYDQRSAFPPATARTAELLHTQTQRFEALLGDLLEISRYDARSAELDTEPVALVALVGEVVGELTPLATQAGSEIHVRAPGGHASIDGDPKLLRRIVRNLLGNAIEHGEGRRIEILIDSDERAVALAVRDHGQGISTENLGRVFDRFWRADPSRKRTIGGTGLGLAISRGDAQMHGGALDVWSEQGAGASFRLTLPRDRQRGFDASPIPLRPADHDPEFEGEDRS